MRKQNFTSNSNNYAYVSHNLENLWVCECSRKRFSEKQAEHWWAENRIRVYEKYNVRMIDKSTIGIGSVDLAH
jgi:hypothetical protein